MATIKDVARLAVVSKMTVSRVINHPDKVSLELRRLVSQAMKELNYIPNFAARALVQNRTQIVKVLILEEMDTTEPYYMNLLSGIAKELDKHYYALQLVSRHSRQIGSCDGLIVTGMRAKDYDEIIAPLEQPVVLFGQNDRGYDFVDVDNEQGMMMATQHLIEIGFENIIFFGIDLNEPFMQARKRGYEKKMSEFGLTMTTYFIKNSSHAAQSKAMRLLHNFRPGSAFVCASDRIGLGVVRAVQEFGYSIPNDVAVTGFDGVFLDQIADPKLTTVRQPVIEMGQELARMLLKKINNNESDKRVGRIFQPKLIIRQSTVR